MTALGKAARDRYKEQQAILAQNVRILQLEKIVDSYIKKIEEYEDKVNELEIKINNL